MTATRAGKNRSAIVAESQSLSALRDDRDTTLGVLFGSVMLKSQSLSALRDDRDYTS